MHVICFQFPHVFVPGSNPVENARVLRALLDCLTEIDRAYLCAHATPGLYQSGVRYARTVEWDPIPAVMGRGYGDCKSFTAWRIAELREKGVACEPVFRWARAPDGFKYHILVRRGVCREAPNGFEDPSARLGMGTNENHPYG